LQETARTESIRKACLNFCIENGGSFGGEPSSLLYRLLPRSAGGLGHLDAADLNPDFVVLMLGINNTWAAEEPVVDSILAGVQAVIASVHERKSRAHIVLQSILPTNDPQKNQTIVLPANERLRSIASNAAIAGYTTFLDLYPAFIDAKGRQITTYFNDVLHPSMDGYKRWRDQLEPFLKLARAARPSR
jgi:lysophospholipase L1-like esterase